jgi:hypothetical protein
VLAASATPPPLAAAFAMVVLMMPGGLDINVNALDGRSGTAVQNEGGADARVGARIAQ